MLISKLTNKIKLILYKFAKFLELQFFITLFCWPILLYWGIPISIASPIGNLIFIPFLMLFLFLSTLIFFCEILFIPNSLLISCLEFITLFWVKLINISSKYWLLACPCPNIFYLIILPILALILIHYKKLRSPYLSTVALAVIIIICFLYFNYIQNSSIAKNLEINNKKIKFIKIKNSNIIIDSEALCQKYVSSFNLVSNFIKNGAYNIDYIIILKPSINVFKSLKDLCNNIIIKNIYMPKWKAKFSHTGWKSWQELLEVVNKHKINLYLISKKPVKLKLDKNKELIISSKEKKINKNNLQYKEIKIENI